MASEAADARGIDRRTFIGRAALATSGLSAAALLDACGSSSGSGPGPGGLPLARPNAPVTLPIYGDNRPIAGGLHPEAGPLQLFNWLSYINPAVIADFEKQYGVTVELSTFTTIDEAFAKITSGTVQYDVFVPEPVLLERLVAGKLLRPLNLSYIPNLRANVWRSLQSPWYDVGARYTVPYTVYTTGIGWRTDRLPRFDPATLPNPWSALWVQGPSIKGRVGMLDDPYQGLGMALLRDGVTDINTENPRLISAAENALIDLVDTAGLKFDTDEYEQLADGELWLHQAWSGDMAAIPAYVPQGTPARVFRYWWPSDGSGPVNIDTLAILRRARHPVLAHLFLNHLLDVEEAFKNFASNYYQQPLNAITAAAVIGRRLLVPTLRNTLIGESQFQNAFSQGPLTGQGESLWQNAWTAVKSA